MRFYYRYCQVLINNVHCFCRKLPFLHLSICPKAFDEGFSDRKRLMQDNEFANLCVMPEFQQLLVQGI
jgi:hypothetical protein